MRVCFKLPKTYTCRGWTDIHSLSGIRHMSTMKPNQVVARLTDVGMTYDSTGRTLFSDLSVSFLAGAKIGLLGANGAGKSTLMKVIAGEETEIQGEVITSEGVRVGYLRQEPELDYTKTVHENILEGVADKIALMEEYEAISLEFADPDADFDELMVRQEKVQAQIEMYDCWDMTYKIKIASEALKCPPGDSAIEPLSGGQKRRVALCRLLLSNPDMLLLDEPTNHLDDESVQWLETYLDDYKGLVIAITHDRYFLDKVASHILELSNSRLYAFKGNYAEWLEQKYKRTALAGKAEEKNAKAMERELTWLRKNQGMSSNQKRKEAYEEAMKERKAARSNVREEGGTLLIPEGPRVTNYVLKLNDVGWKFDDSEDFLFRNVNLNLQAGDVLGIVGPNGTGKSTLMKLIHGINQPTEGEVMTSENIRVGYNSQDRDDLDSENSVWREICDGRTHIEMDHVSGRTIAARAYVSQFHFAGEAQNKLVGMLSGGERNRVHLAKSLSYGSNLLLLDEPTNDLDVGTLRSLEEGLVMFNGAVCIVSHDRWFLDRVCTHILAFEDTKVTLFDGNYSMYLDHRRMAKAKGKKN